MSEAFLKHLRATLDEIEAAGLFKRERLLTGPQGGRIRVAGAERRARSGQSLRQQLPRPRRPSRRHRRGEERDGRIRLRHGLGAVHLRRADAPPRARAGDRPPPRQGRRDPLRRLFRRQWRRVRAAARRSRRDHLRQPQPRLDHRRRPPLEGQALPVRQLGHERARGSAQGGRFRGRPVQAHRDRRRVLDGRLRRQTEGGLRAGRPLRRARAGRRLPCDRASGREGARHAGADRRGRARRYRHRHVRQDARRRHGRLRRRRAADRRSFAPAGAALSVLQLARPADRRRAR